MPARVQVGVRLGVRRVRRRAQRGVLASVRRSRARRQNRRRPKPPRARPPTAHPPRAASPPPCATRSSATRRSSPYRTETGSPRGGGERKAPACSCVFFFFFFSTTQEYARGVRVQKRRSEDRSVTVDTNVGAFARASRTRASRTRASSRTPRDARRARSSRGKKKRRFLTRAFVSTRKETPFETAHIWIAVRVSFAPSYLLHARQVHGFRHRELARGGHRPAFRLRCRDGRVTRGQRACGDKTYAENIDRHRRRFARRKTTSRQSRRNVNHGVSVDALITRKRTLSRPTYPPPPPLPLPPVNRSLSRSPRPPRPCARIATFVAGSDGWRLYRGSQVALPSCVSSTRRAGFLRVCLAERVPRSESSRGDFASLGRTSPETASRYAGCRMRDRVFSPRQQPGAREFRPPTSELTFHAGAQVFFRGPFAEAKEARIRRGRERTRRVWRVAEGRAMSGWGCDEGGDAEATRDGWGAAPTTTRPAVVSNLRDSAVGALFSPDEPSPNEWCGAGYRGRWGVGDGHEDRGDGDDAGGWGGDETFGDGDDAHDWGRSDVVDDDGMSVGAAEDAAADDGRWGWGLADDHPDAPRDGPVITDAAARSNDKKGGPIGDADRSELQIATSRDDAPLRVADLADPADKENVEASKRRGTSHPGADASAAVPAPPRRMHGWKSNWAVEGMVRAKANSVRAVGARRRWQETSRETPRGAPSSSSPSSSPAGSATRTPSAEARRACDAASRKKRTPKKKPKKPKPQTLTEGPRLGLGLRLRRRASGGSGLTQARPASPGAERRRVASLRAAAPRARPVLKTRSSSARRPVPLTLEPWRPFRRRTAATTISASPCRRAGAGTGGRSASPPPPRDG